LSKKARISGGSTNDLNTDKGEVGDLVVQVHLGPPILSSVYAVISAFSA